VKTLTRKQIEARKEKAVRFVQDDLGDPDHADEIEDESVEDYAARRRIQILKNPVGRNMKTVRLVSPTHLAEPDSTSVNANTWPRHSVLVFTGT
jgi:hypothetical protein